MGQSISKASSTPPLTLRDCLVNGRIDLTRYRLYARRQYEDIYDRKKYSSEKKRKHDDIGIKKKVKRSVKKHNIQFPNNDGTMRDVTFKDSAWYNLYIYNKPKSKCQLKIFRRRFRLPYEEFIKMIDDLKLHNNFITKFTLNTI